MPLPKGYVPIKYNHLLPEKLSKEGYNEISCEKIDVMRLKKNLKSRLKSYNYLDKFWLVRKGSHLLVGLFGDNWQEKNALYQSMREKLVQRKKFTYHDYSFLPDNPHIVNNILSCPLNKPIKEVTNIASCIQSKIKKHDSLKGKVKVGRIKNQLNFSFLKTSSIEDQKEFYLKIFRPAMLNKPKISKSKNTLERTLFVANNYGKLNNIGIKNYPPSFNPKLKLTGINDLSLRSAAEIEQITSATRPPLSIEKNRQQINFLYNPNLWGRTKSFYCQFPNSSTIGASNKVPLTINTPRLSLSLDNPALGANPLNPSPTEISPTSQGSDRITSSSRSPQFHLSLSLFNKKSTRKDDFYPPNKRNMGYDQQG